MQFQHSELLGAREKIRQMNHAMEKSTKERDDSMLKARQLLCQRRKKIESMERDESKQLLEEPMPLEEQKEGLTREVNTLMLDWELLPKLMTQQASNVMTNAGTLFQECDHMEDELSKYPDLHDKPSLPVADGSESTFSGHDPMMDERGSAKESSVSPFADAIAA
jgi:hypothetical protein